MKFRKMLSMLLALILVMSIFVGCKAQTEPASEGESSEKKIKVGLSLPTQREERWVKDKKTMEKIADEMGIELLVKTADANMDEQINQVESLLSQGIDALILAPHDGAAAASLVEKAEKEGVPVVAYDRLITNTDKLDAYMTFQSVKTGEKQAEYLTKLVPEGNYIVLAGCPTDHCAGLYKKGAMNIIKPLVDEGKIKIVAEQDVENWLPENALKIVEAALAANNNEIDGILAPNDGTAGAAIQALAAQGLAGKVPVTGQDAEAAAAKRILEGTQSMTVFNDTRELGRAAVETAIKLAKGEAVETEYVTDNGKMEVPSVKIGGKVVDKDNLQEELIDSGYLSPEDIK